MALKVKKGGQQHRHPDAERLHDQPTKRLTVNVPEDIHRRLKMHAASEDKQMSEIVFALVTRYLDGHVDLSGEPDDPELHRAFNQG